MTEISDHIRQTVDQNDVVMFMKGTPDFPQCGFSMRAVNIVRGLGVPFVSVNVLDDFEVREGIKSFSDWPTIPQLYIDSSFVGGSDIMMQMYQSGDLTELVKKGEADAS